MTQENIFSNQMKSKSDSELQKYISNKQDFQDKAVLAAAWELEKRNKTDDISQQVVEEIYQKQKLKTEEIEKVNKNSEVTDDPNAPELFHPKFILFFGVLFSVFGGSILMALNLARIEKKKEAWITVFAGLAFSTIQVIVLNQINTTGLTLPISFLGMYLLEYGIWKKHKTLDLKFRKRNVLVPSIIALVVWFPVIYEIIVTNGL